MTWDTITIWVMSQFQFSLRVLSDSCAFAVSNGLKTLTAETQRTSRTRKEFQMRHHHTLAPGAQCCIWCNNGCAFHQ